MLRILVVFAALTFAAASRAETPGRPPPLLDLSRKMSFEAAEWTPAAGPTSGTFRDLWPQALAMVGREDISLRLFPQTHTARICDAIPGRMAFDPVRDIIKRARKLRIVILNEAHHRAWHRGFFEDVAVALRREGFTILAAESFNPNINESRPNYPRTSDGFYVTEPGYAEALRRSLRLGYRLVPYEFVETISEEEAKRRSEQPLRERSMASIERRERAQAENLMARIFERDKTSKVLVYAGYSHAEEWPTSPDGKTE